jgi:integrase
MEGHNPREGRHPPSRKGKKVPPCRKCEKRHRGVYENDPGSDVWYVRVADQHHRIFRKKVGPHGLALKVYQRWKAEIAEGRFFRNAITTSDERLDDAIQAYIDRRGDNLGGDGPRILKRWKESPQLKGKTVRDFSLDDAEAFLKERSKSGRYSASTRNHDVSFLFTFYKDYEDRRRRHPKRRHEPPVANIMEGLRLGEKDRERTRWLSEAEEVRLLATERPADEPTDWKPPLPSDVDRAIVRMGVLTGLRESNLLALDWDRDVKLTQRKLRGWSRKGRPQGKSLDKPLRERWVPINDELMGILRSLPSFPGTLREAPDAEHRWIFPNATGTGHVDPKNWYHRVWRPALEAARITNFRFHDLRHTTATRLGKAGVRTRDIATALGHADERMAQRYEHAAAVDGHMLAVMQKLTTSRVLTTNLALDSEPVEATDEPSAEVLENAAG